MGVRGNIYNRLLESVEVYKSEVTEDEIGGRTEELIKVADVMAKVMRFSGSRFAYFKRLGYNYPLEIVMYDTPFDQLRIDGQIVQVQSKEMDAENRLKIKIIGDLVDARL